MPAAITLPKVAQYIKNVGKSVKLASIDYLAEAAPATSDFLETNKELFKEIYSSTINYKQTIKKANRAIKTSKIYEAYDVGKKALFEDLKTGNFYNKEREEAMGMKGLDMEMDDMDFDPSMLDFADDDSSDAAKQSRAFERALEVSSKAQAGVTARSADLVATTIKAGNTANFVQNEKILSTLNSGMTGIFSLLNQMGKYLEGPMMAHLQNTKTFQENSLKYQEQLTKQMDELLQMQRNLYAVEQGKPDDDALNNIISYEGMPDIKEYGKQIYKNLKKALGPEVGMILGDSFGKNSNTLLTMVGSPLKVLPELLVKTIVPITVKKAAEQFDKSISGVFTSMIARFNSMGSDDSSASPIFKWLGKLLGIDITRKRGVDTTKFKKGPVPWDGVARQTLIEVIPGHLRRIESALTGQIERLYDMNAGKWTDIKKIEKEYKDRQESAVTQSFSEVTGALNQYINELKTKGNKESKALADELTEAMDKIMHKVYEEKGDFKGYRATKDQDTGEMISAADYYSVDERVYKIIMDLMSGKTTKNGKTVYRNASNMAHLAQEVMGQINSFNSYLRMVEENNYPVMQLFNGAFKTDTGYGAKFNPNAKRKEMTGFTNFLIDTVDDDDKNIFYYLRGIYESVMKKKDITNNSNEAPIKSDSSRHRRRKVGLKPLQGPRLPSADSQDQDNDPGLSPDQINEDWNYDEAVRMAHELAQNKKKDKYTDEEATLIGELRKATTFGERFKAIKDSINSLMQKPAMILTSMLDMADAKVYSMLFGKEEMLEAEKRFGRKPGGIVEHLVFRIEETFDKLDDWFKEHVFDKVKKWMDDAGITDKAKRLKDKIKDKIRWNDIKDAFTRKFGFAKSQVKGAFTSVYDDTVGNLKRRSDQRKANASHFDDLTDLYTGAFNPEDIADNISYEDFIGNVNPYANEDDYGEYGLWAKGKVVTKRGLAVVSPGETIIPSTFSKAGQQRQLSKEKAFARRFGLKNTKYYAEGTDSANGAAQTAPIDDTKAVNETIKKVVKEISPGTSIVDIAVNSLIGGGVSLITGMVGGPLLGAAVGAGVGVVKQSQTVRDFLFGTETVDEEGNVVEKKGLLSKKFQKNFTKYFPDMKNYGIVGAVAGLFTPFGLVGGLMAGGAVGFLKNNEKFQDYLFGPRDEQTGQRDGGLISKKFREQVEKAAPRMAVGAIGGALFGPFGLLGGAALGSALGFVSTTDQFHEFIFGKEDENGNKKGGVVQALKEGLVDPALKKGKELLEKGKEFLNKKILTPLKNFIEPMAQMIKNGISNVAESIKNAFDAKVVTPIQDFLQHRILEPVGRVLGKIIKAPLALGKSIISAPFAALGFVGNNIRASQIGKGTATDMTAAERMQWRDQHKNRYTWKHVNNKDRFSQIDRMLTTNFEGEEGLNKLKQARDNMALYLNARKEFGDRVAKLEQELVNTISDILNESTMTDPDTQETVTVYTYVRGKTVARINKLIAQGKLEEVEQELESGRFINVPADVKDQIISKLHELGQPIYDAIERQKNYKDYNARVEQQMAKFGLKGRKDFTAFKKVLDKEISTRESGKAEDDEANRKSVAEQQTEKMGEFLNQQTSQLVTSLNQIRTAIYHLKGEEDPVTKAEEEAAAEEAKAAENSSGFGEDIGDIPNLNPVNATMQQAKGLSSRILGSFGYTKRDLGRVFRSGKTLLGNAKRFVKNQAAEGWAAGRAEEQYKDEREEYRNDMISKGAAMFPEAPSYIDSHASMAKEGAKDAVQSFGGLLTGSKNKLIALANKGYHMVTSGGKFGLADGSGDFLRTEDNRAIQEAQEQESMYKQKTMDALQTMSKGIIGTVTGLLGSGWEKVKNVKNSILDTINNVIDASPLGTVIKAVFGIGKVAIGLSLAGHFAAFWTESIWKPVIKPFWENTLKPAISGIGEKVYNFLTEHFPSLTGVVDGIKSGFETFIANPAGAIWDFFVDGLKKFWDYVEVPLYNLVAKAFKGVSLADFTAEREMKKKEYQAVDENGNLLYLDENGNTTTENTGTAKMTTTNVTTESWNKSLFNTVTNKSRKTRQTAYNAQGYEFICDEFYGGQITIQNTETGAYITLPDGFGSKSVTVGYRVDRDGNPLVMDKGVSMSDVVPGVIVAMVAKAVIGAAVGAAATTAAAAKIGTTAGAMVGGPVGAVVGLVGGVVIGAGVSLCIYAINSSKGYLQEYEGIDPLSPEGQKLLTSFGINGNEWPSFPTPSKEQSEGSSSSLTTQGYYTDKVDYQKNTIQDYIDSNNGTSGSGRARSGRGHIYQKAAEIANQKFGNSTIGEAGCGPVAATNLINKLGGNMDVGTAAAYAESGGFIDPSTGGATTNYISSILNTSGIPSAETSDKSYIYNSLRNGNPVVMLGNSGRGASDGTPFGSSDHYITAMGLDRQGNIIAEDPDLPNSYRRYSASRVMKDLDVGIATGMSRHRRRSSGMSRSKVISAIRSAMRRKSGKALTYKASISEWKFRASECLAAVSNDYTLIIRNDNSYFNDNGGMTVGRYRFHGNYARAFVWALISDMRDIYSPEEIKTMLGGKGGLYDWADGIGDVSRAIESDEEEKALLSLMDTEIGRNTQDKQIISILNTIYSKTVESVNSAITVENNEDIIIYLCALAFNGFTSTELKSLISGAKTAAGKSSAGDLTLEEVYNKSISEPNVSDTLKSNFGIYYTFLSGTEATEGGKVTVDTSSTDTNYSAVMSNYTDLYSNYTDSMGNSGILAALGDLIKSVMNKIFGGALMSLFGEKGTQTASGSLTSGSYSFGSGSYKSLSATESAQQIWNYLKKSGYTDYAASGLMGCWQKESSNRADRVEGDYLSAFPGFSKVLASNDALDSYVSNILFPAYARSDISIDKDAYKGSDGHYYPGVGLAQWTGPRGYNLFEYAKNNSKDWRNLDPQLRFFTKEDEERGLKALLNQAGSPSEAARLALDNYEMYKGYSSTSDGQEALSERAGYAESIYKNYLGTDGEYTAGNLVSSGGQSNNAQQALVDWMQSIEGKVPYSASGPNDPDKGSASCASTVAWAYRHALGYDGLGNMSYSNMQSNNDFGYVYKSNLMNGGSTSGFTDSQESLLQPGDVLYYARDNRNESGNPYHVGHTEMYMGNGMVIGHGGPNWEDYGTRTRTLMGDAKRLVAAKRYLPFVNGEQPAFTNVDGSQGTYPSSTTGAAAFSSLITPSSNLLNSFAAKNLGLDTTTSSIPSYMLASTYEKKSSTSTEPTLPNDTPFVTAPTSTGNMFTDTVRNSQALLNSALDPSFVGKNGVSNAALLQIANINKSGSGRARKSDKKNINLNARKMLKAQKTTMPYMKYMNTDDYSKVQQKEDKAFYSDSGTARSSIPTRRSTRSGKALTSAVSYEDFLNIIINLLTIIAQNSDKTNELIEVLSKKGINLSSTDIANAGTSRSAQARLKDAIRNSGLNRPGSTKSGSSPYGGAAGESGDNIQYVVGLMESLARF